MYFILLFIEEFETSQIPFFFFFLHLESIFLFFVVVLTLGWVSLLFTRHVIGIL